jgi:endoglucanase
MSRVHAVCATIVRRAVSQLTLLAVLALVAEADDGPAMVMAACDRPFSFAYLSWQDKVAISDGSARIRGVNNQGGAGCVQAMDLAGAAARRPALRLRVGTQNRAAGIQLVLVDGGGRSARWLFSLQGLGDVATTVTPVSGGDLLHPDAREKGELDLAHLTQWQLSGDWAGALAMDVAVERILLLGPGQAGGDAAGAAGTGGAGVRAADQPVRAAHHPADGARLHQLGAVAHDILALELRSGEYKPMAMVPYAPKAGDRRSEGEKAWVMRTGRPLEEQVGQTVERLRADGGYDKLGTISFDGKWLFQADGVAGTLLDTTALDAPGAYAISSKDDPAYATALHPSVVWRKGKPDSPQTAVTVQHVYLKLPTPLREGATYSVQLDGVNSREERIDYHHDTRMARSEALHASQLGYRPSDPYKRGYCSIWLGSGGGYQHDGLDAFELVEAKSGATVFTGKPQLGKAKDAAEALQASKDYCRTAVWWLDFSAFSTPGTYRLRIPGIGTSQPFAIDEGVWEGAYRLGMRGILSQRSGIALGAPFLAFTRPRPCHPDDGVKAYQIDIGINKGQEGPRGEALLRLWKEKGRLEEVANVWGGYQDGGDWDVYTTTLSTADLLTESFELAPEPLRQLALSLPAAEAGNAIPDLLDEALWGLSCFRRLQRADGAVRDGFGDGWGARKGDVSWIDSNPVCVYAPSPATSWYYAAIAANMARVLVHYDAAQAGALRTSALSAWTWAEAQPTAAVPNGAKRTSPQWLQAHAQEAYAAVALYWLTRDAAFHERFKALCELQEAKDTAYAGGWIEPFQQGDATFTYARLPAELADATLQAHAKGLFALAGNVAVHFMAGNAFNLASSLPGIPVMEFCGLYTNPGMNSTIARAHYLSHDARYLAALVASANFRCGANPENRCFTTGMGADPIRYPLKLDSHLTGQPAPVGLTVYGPSDQSMPGGSDWVHQWLLTPERMVPGSRTWPAPESYVDLYTWPGANEYCVNSPVAQAVYTSCYLAGRR